MAIIRLLGGTLRANAPGVLPILSMDAVRVHLHDRVILECANWGIRVVVVPARMTWLLQPLDTHAFAQLKRVVRDAYQARLGSEGARALSTASWVAVVTNTVCCFLRRENWARAFAHNGFGSMQQELSQRVLSTLDLQAPPAVSATEPSAATVLQLYPRGSRADTRLVTRRRRTLRIPTTPWLRARHEERRAASATRAAASSSSSTAAVP